MATSTSPLLAEQVKVAEIVVPLDGSPLAERALPVCDWVAGMLDVDVQVVEVVGSDQEAEAAVRYLGSVGPHHRATSWEVLRGEDVAEVLAEEVTGTGDRIACLATHGRDRSASLVGSVAASLLDHSCRQTLLVGPGARVCRRPRPEAAVVVALDGTSRDDTLFRVALGWAERLARPLVVATVAEPTPSYHEGQVMHRARGPADPERYLASFAARAAGSDVAVDVRVIYDPVSVRDGLLPLLARTAALVVLGSGHHHGLSRMMLGTHAARIVHDAPVPVLVVPPR